MSGEQVIVKRDGSVATIRMNNPARLNVLNRSLTAELIEALAEAGSDDGIRAIVLTGEGRGFCAGADLGELEGAYRSGERPKLSPILSEGYNRLIPLLVESPKPVVAAVNGVAAGAGVSLALACDLRLAGDNASFSMAFVRIGLIPDSGACFLLPRAVGMGKALELALLSDKVDAATALDIGLVNRMVPADRLQDEAHDLASRLADLPTKAIAMTKKMFQAATRLTLAETMDLEAEAQDRAAATDDHLEGVMAFLDKRTPAFKGH
jgi:2-(1,2-epoxy-1,2-dihydrophenyl)acetyl-CoA isomerase